MLMIYEQKLHAEMQKSRQKNYVAPGKEFIVGGIFVVLRMEVTSNCNSDISDKTWWVWLQFYVFHFYYHLFINVYILKNLYSYF
jgi:hypothetical protein